MRSRVESGRCRTTGAERQSAAPRAGVLLEILEDAGDYATHAGRSDLTVEDTRLAINMALHTGDVSRRPTSAFLASLATQCNSRSLPKKQCNLPAARDTFVVGKKTRNWQLVVNPRHRGPPNPQVFTPGTAADAPAGRKARQQIPIRLGADAGAHRSEPTSNAAPFAGQGIAPKPTENYDGVDDDEDDWEEG